MTDPFIAYGWWDGFTFYGKSSTNIVYRKPYLVGSIATVQHATFDDMLGAGCQALKGFHGIPVFGRPTVAFAEWVRNTLLAEMTITIDSDDRYARKGVRITWKTWYAFLDAKIVINDEIDQTIWPCICHYFSFLGTIDAESVYQFRTGLVKAIRDLRPDILTCGN